MHIRFDWKQWYMEPYKRVSTLCGMKTTANNAGIPTVSPSIDWCFRCATVCIREIEILSRKDNAGEIKFPKEIARFYSDSWVLLEPLVQAARDRSYLQQVCRSPIDINSLI